MNLKCNKCGSDKLFVEIQGNGNRRGLYCGECGKWQKWLTKPELQVAKFNGVKILDQDKKQNIRIDTSNMEAIMEELKKL